MGKQLKLNLNKGRHGGRRAGSGRRRVHSPGVAHRCREKVTHRTPLHINFKYRVEIKKKFCLKLLKRAILNSRRHGLAVVHFSLQHNHVHLIVEASDNETLTTGMRSLTVTFARGLRKGRVQMERYHLHVLRTLRETKNAVNYVLFNEQRHALKRSSKVDEFSSLLQLPNALKLIKGFAEKQRVTVILGRKSFHRELSEGGSYLLRRVLLFS